MEARRSWHKFRKLAGSAAPRKRGLIAVVDERRVFAGAVARESNGAPDYQDEIFPFDDLESAWEQLSHKYGAVSGTFVDRKELAGVLSQVGAPKPGKPAWDCYQTQLMELRAALRVDTGEKTRLAQHLGDKPVSQIWPRDCFLLSVFDSFVTELLPERKLLLLGVVDGPGQIDAMLLEFHGKALRNFTEPDWAGFDWQIQDAFRPETAARFVLWCENRYLLPTYAFFVTRKTWEECRALQREKGEGAAWKHLMKAKGLRDAEPEVRVEPEPWPLRAALHWNSVNR
ncbi:MAG: hypothetical protein HUU37_06830 [Bdellovibrionales bacterium]|nr:hypothetical protein [Bdellovibrionales bacterium]